MTIIWDDDIQEDPEIAPNIDAHGDLNKEIAPPKSADASNEAPATIETFSEKNNDVAANTYLLFEAAFITYALPLYAIQETIKIPPISPLPGASDYFLGIINLRGVATSVIDFGRLNGCAPCRIKEKTSIIILNIPKMAIGIMVDNTHDLVFWNENEIDRKLGLCKNENSGIIYGIGQHDGKQATVIDLEFFLNSDQFCARNNTVVA